jgi:hypothetical protein
VPRRLAMASAIAEGDCSYLDGGALNARSARLAEWLFRRARAVARNGPQPLTPASGAHARPAARVDLAEESAGWDA